MSVFCQYAPYELAEGDWDSRRDEIAAMALDAIEVRAPDIRDCIEEVQVMGPPDIEERIGLSGGHIFQGQALPAQMWDRRLEARTPVEGLYLCGAATHPGGSVIALNGRIAAGQVLAAAPSRLAEANSKWLRPRSLAVRQLPARPWVVAVVAGRVVLEESGARVRPPRTGRPR